jgi:hypothetical protein
MHRITLATYLGDFKIELRFDTSEIFILDTKPYLQEGIATSLLDEFKFKQFYIESGGGLAWPNGYDFCPNFLYTHLKRLAAA